MEERIIQFVPFLQSRAQEIATLQNVLKSKFLNCTAQPFQVLHKHMRRRAMSHNRYRIPSSLRKQMFLPGLIEKELGQKIPKCRKHIRKNKQLIFFNRSKKVSWMETHLYQVKRMKMINYCGYKVSEKANEKNFRAVHRYFDHGNMIFDASFYQIADGNLQEGLQIDNHTIIHPNDIPETDFVIYKDKFNIFQIIGKESLSIINEFLSLFQCSIDGKDRQYFQFEYSYQKIQNYTSQKGRVIKTFEDYDDNFNNINQNPINKGHQDLEQSIWNIDEQYYKNRFIIDSRVRYTHQKVKKLQYQKELAQKKQQQAVKQSEQKEDIQIDPMKKKKAMRWLLKQFDKNENDISVEEEILENNQDNIIESDLIKQISNPKNIQQEIKQKTTLIKLLIIPQSQQLQKSIDLGYKIISNLGTGLIIWKLFNQLKLKAIGLRDIKQLCLENNIMFDNYEKVDYFEKYLQSRNKINYLALQFPYPFSFDFNICNKWSGCTLIAYKNIPKEQALIFQPLQSDFELLQNGIYKIQITRTIDEKPQISNKIELLSYERQLADIKLERKIIGQVQYGNISLQHGKGVGQGKIDSKLSKKNIIVLFRNHNSEYYFFADCIVN